MPVSVLSEDLELSCCLALAARFSYVTFLTTARTFFHENGDFTAFGRCEGMNVI
jgi:hypothetical protein